MFRSTIGFHEINFLPVLFPFFPTRSIKVKKRRAKKDRQERRIFRFYRTCQAGGLQSRYLLISGGPGVRRAWARDSIPHVEAVDGLHGDSAQERHRGETSVQVRDAFHCRWRRGHLLHKLPRGGPVWSGRLHQGVYSFTRRSARRHWREASAHALLQVSHQFQQKELRVSQNALLT